MDFVSEIEKRASAAPDLGAFTKFSLRATKDTVTELLAVVGQRDMFAQYTRHDISHVNKLLEIADWLVPSTSATNLTTADCLLITLAMYFHDVGMVVTTSEFERRDDSDFPEFRDGILNAAEEINYRDKIKRMTPNQIEPFLYQIGRAHV